MDERRVYTPTFRMSMATRMKKEPIGFDVRKDE